MTPSIVLADLAAIAAKVSASNLWVARALRNTAQPTNRMRQYARLAARIGRVVTVRDMLHQRMIRQTPGAAHLIERALAVYDHEIQSITLKQVA